jgi:hypothetical protein
MNLLTSMPFLNRKTLSSLLGLSLDGSRLEGVVLRRSNGALQIQQQFKADLSLDPLTNDVELVGREILNHLEAAGVRERRCVVAVPLQWALSAQTQIPDLPENDIPGFLQLEAERGFPTDLATLEVSQSRLVSGAGERRATFVGIPKSHIQRLEQVLRAAKLKPLNLSIGIAALQPADAPAGDGVLALAIGDNHVGLQITCGGGVAALRALEGAVETDSGERVLRSDFLSREIRITLGQLPSDLRATVKRIRLFGPHSQVDKLAGELRPRFEAGGLTVEPVSTYPAAEFSRTIPQGTAVSPAFSLAARRLTECDDPLQFLPPRESVWRELISKYASGKWRTAGVAAAALVILVGGAFGVQQWQLARLRSRWTAISVKVKDLSDVQDQIQKYRPWFDDSIRHLSVLKAVTAAFPEDGAVTAKSLEIRDVPDVPGASVVSCSGNAASYAALQKTVHQLGAINGVSDLNVPTRGKAPIQFTFDFHLNGGGAR